jgi:putative transposase
MNEEVSGAHTRWWIRYHCVWGTKYRYQIITEPVANQLLKTTLGVCERYEFTFDSMGTDGDHVHLIAGLPPKQGPELIIRTVKSITAREIFNKFPSIKKLLWGGSIWATGYYVGTVGKEKPYNVMRNYVLNQGTKPEKDKIEQLRLIRS